jgi:hypothetical protein
MSAKLQKKKKNFIRWQKHRYSYNRWLGNRSLKANYYTLISYYHLSTRVLRFQ